MLIEAARRAEAAAKEMLACINAGSAPCTEVREALEVSKAFIAVTSAFQVGAAQVIAAAERHGDGGTQVLADTAGMSRREAHSQVKTARVIEAAPAVRDAVETGRVSQANARRLAEVISKTSAADVESDGDLLAKAQSMRPEQFTKEARRWAADRQHDGGEADYRRLRARRYVRIWDSDDGTVELHGKFDPVAGRRIGNRLQAHPPKGTQQRPPDPADVGLPGVRPGPAKARAALRSAKTAHHTPGTARTERAGSAPAQAAPGRPPSPSHEPLLQLE